MEQATRTRLERNIFHAAHQACEPWDTFPWHTGVRAAHSSQALAIDVFGTIQTSAHCESILDALAEALGLPTGGPWTITLEWAARPTLLNEPRPTQVDVYLENPESVILCECTFTEPDGGACSQTIRRNGRSPCKGNYVQPIHHGHDSTSRCALSGKGIQYWDIIPKVFYLDDQTDYHPCPFAGPAYQWMRNLVVAYKVGRQKNKQAAVVIVYADGPGLPMAHKVRSQEWTEFTRMVRQDQVALHVRSYQEILALAQGAIGNGSGEQTPWQELGEWVHKKITKCQAGRRKSKKSSHSPSHTSVSP